MTFLSPALIDVYEDVIRAALESGRLDDEHPKHDFLRPVQMATYLEDWRWLARLLEAGTEVDFALRDDIEAPFVIAVREGRFDNLRLLAAAGADLVRVGDETRARTAAFFCRFEHDDEITAWSLWIGAGADPSGCDDHGTPHLQNAIRRCRADIMTLLLANEADHAARDPVGYTALTLACACRRNPERFVLPLLEAGADVNERGPAGETPLIAALRESIVFSAVSDRIARLLLKYGADAKARDTKGRHALHHLAQTLAWRVEHDHAGPEDRECAPTLIRDLTRAGLSLHDPNPNGVSPIDLLRSAWSSHEVLDLVAASA